VTQPIATKMDSLQVLHEILSIISEPRRKLYCQILSKSDFHNVLGADYPIKKSGVRATVICRRLIQLYPLSLNTY